MSHTQTQENRSGTGDRIPCPKCGYPILALAPTCKWCSAVFDPAAAPPASVPQNPIVETIPNPENLAVVLRCGRQLSQLSRAELAEERDFLSRETARLWRNGWLWLACGIASCLLLLSVVTEFRNLEGIILVQLAIGLLTTGSIVCLVLAFITFARSKGLPEVSAVLCVLGPIGLGIVLTFPNRYTERLQIIDALLSWRARVENKLSAGDSPDIAGSAT